MGDITDRVMEHGFFGFLYGLRINPLQIWTFLVCLYVTIGAISFHCCPRSSATNYMHIPTVVGRIKNGMQSLADRYRNRYDVPDPDYANITQEMGAPPVPRRITSLLYRLKRRRLPPRDDIGIPLPEHRYAPVRPPRPPRARSSPPGHLQNGRSQPTAPLYPADQLPFPEPPGLEGDLEVHLDIPHQQAFYLPTDRLLQDRTLVVNCLMGAEIVVPISAGKEKIHALVDTGACLSIMPIKVAKKLKEAEHLDRALPMRVSIGGNTYPIYGSLITTITLGDHSVRAPLVIIDGGDYDLIIGTDLQAVFGYIGVDYKAHNVHTPLSGPVPYGRLNSIYATPVRICLEQNEVIPARARTLLQARPETELFPKCDYVFEPQKKGLNKKGVYSGRAIINSGKGGMDESISLQIMHVSEKEVQL